MTEVTAARLRKFGFEYTVIWKMHYCIAKELTNYVYSPEFGGANDRLFWREPFSAEGNGDAAKIMPVASEHRRIDDRPPIRCKECFTVVIPNRHIDADCPRFLPGCHDESFGKLEVTSGWATTMSPQNYDSLVVAADDVVGTPDAHCIGLLSGRIGVAGPTGRNYDGFLGSPGLPGRVHTRP